MPALSFQRRTCLPERRHQLTQHRHAHVQVPLEIRHEPPWRQSDRQHSAAVRIYSSLGKPGAEAGRNVLREAKLLAVGETPLNK